MKKITIDNKTIEISDESYEVFKKQFTKPESRHFVPEIEQEYWYVYLGGETYLATNHDDGYDKHQIATGSCFRTKEDAEKYNAYLIAKTTIQRSSEFTPDWDDADQEKWFVFYAHDMIDLSTDYKREAQHSAHTYYATREEAEQAMKDYKAEYNLVFAYERGE